jgi:hypothetical protein
MTTPEPGDLVIISTNNILSYGVAIQYTCNIFRYIYLGRVSDKPVKWTLNRLTYDKLYTDHITGDYVPYRVFKVDDNQVSPEHLVVANKFREKFKTILSK